MKPETFEELIARLSKSYQSRKKVLMRIEKKFLEFGLPADEKEMIRKQAFLDGLYFAITVAEGGRANHELPGLETRQ